MDEEAPVAERLERLHHLIEGVDTAILTTVCADGSLVSRPMATQTRDSGIDLWFITTIQSRKCGEIVANPHVNLSYAHPITRAWTSVNGFAVLNKDAERIRQLYNPSWKAWLPDESGARDGGPHDPRIVLIEVKAISATYFAGDRAPVLVTFSKVNLPASQHKPSSEAQIRHNETVPAGGAPTSPAENAWL